MEIVKHCTKHDQLEMREFKLKHIRRSIDHCRTHIDHKRLGPLEHELLKIELRSMEVFAVDLSYAQYGEKAAICDWNGYVRRRVSQEHRKSKETVERSGGKLCNVNDYTNAAVDRLMKNRKAKTGETITESVLEERKNTDLLKWQQLRNYSLSNLWIMPEKDYFVIQKDLLEFTEARMRESWKSHGITSYKIEGRVILNHFKDTNNELWT